MKINRPTMFLLVLLLPALGNTPSASNVSAPYTSLEATCCLHGSKESQINR